MQRAHQPAYVVKQGQHSPSFDAPERVDSILAAINARRLGAVIEPTDAGLEPIRAVHDAAMIEYLATAYEQQKAQANVSTPVFPTFFPPPGQRRRPGCFTGLKGFYCTNTGAPIDENTWKAVVASAHCAVTGAGYLRSGKDRIRAVPSTRPSRRP